MGERPCRRKNKGDSRVNIFFYDTETTGLPDWSKPSELPHQPHIVQLAAILANERGSVLGSLNLLVQPNGWSWDENCEAFKTHGITVEHADAAGVREEVAVDIFLDLASRAKLRVGFSETFDRRIIRIALKRYGDEETAEGFWKNMESYCTMWKSKKQFGFPDKKTLAETHAHLFGRPHEKQHTAMGDCQATMRIYYELMRLQSVTEAEPATA